MAWTFLNFLAQCGIFSRIFKKKKFRFFSRDDSSSGEEDLDDEGIQRRRELMRQRAMARAQIGMGQEEV